MRSGKRLYAVALIAMGIVGGALASNMTFKFVPDITTSDPDSYDISIPLVNNYATLSDIFNDISTSPGCTAASVTIFNPDQSSCVWNGPFSCDAPYAPGQGVRVTTNGPCHGWVIVGGHNPTFVFNFALTDPSVYDVALPYHTTAMTLEDLFSEIPSCASVTAFNPDQSSCVWNGPFSCNTPIEVGKAYRITVGSPYTLATSWVSRHY